MEAPNDDILRRAVQGDRVALGTLLGRCDRAARQSLADKIPHRFRTLLTEDDVMQEAYLDAILGIRQFRSTSEGSFVSWLTTVAQRNLLDAVKELEREEQEIDRPRLRRALTDDSYVDLVETIAATSAGPTTVARRSEAAAKLKEAIGQLPEDYARLVIMYDLEQRPVADVAQALHRTPGAVFMLRARAHRKLAALLGPALSYLTSSA
ncbi:MAG: sigma-70 family RNA polymerase sigma factor [Phycisphaerae bacterium]|nr:sigma-70 family RNA polymerase sigma factor [Phycisphaerae bacterium]